MGLREYVRRQRDASTSPREWLLAARAARPGTTVRELARSAGVSRSTAYRWLSEATGGQPCATESQDLEVLGGPVTPDVPDPAAAIREGLRWAVGSLGVPEALAGPNPQRTEPDPFVNHPADRGLRGWTGPWR